MQSGYQQAAVVEINSETDFVGRSGPFQQLVTAAARAALGLMPSAAAAAAAAGAQVQEVDFQQVQLQS
jgi:translation elongation factor EF-Ts